MKKEVHFSAQSDEWSTPRYVFDMLNEEFHFTLDAAATKENAKCVRFYTREDDGLKKKWGGGVGVLQPAIFAVAGMDREGARIGTIRRDYGHAHPRPHGYESIPRQHIQQGRGRDSLPARSPQVRRFEKFSPIPEHGSYF